MATSLTFLKSCFAAGLSLFLLACAGSPMSPEEAEALYLERYDRAEDARARQAFGEIYDVLAPIKGADSPSPLAQASTSIFAPEVLAKAFAYAQARNTSALLIVQDGELVQSQYFAGATPDTLIVAKSLAKPLGVLAIGRAIEEGYIERLDEPVSNYITQWQGTPKSQILIRHLLDMRSGLQRQSRYSGPDDVMRRAYLHPRHDEIIINEYPLTHAPGTRYEYSNANAELVAPLIERATGMRYERWLSKSLLKPLAAAGGTIWLNRPNGTAHAGCCLSLPAATWVKLAMLVMQDGMWAGKRLLPTGYTAQMRTPTAQNPHAGMGLYIGDPYKEYRGHQNPDQGGGTFHSEPYKARDILLFDGNGNQVIYMLPAQNILIARFGNFPDPKTDWDNAFLPNLLLTKQTD